MLGIPTVQTLDTPLGGFLDNVIGWGGFGTVGYHELDESPESSKIPVAVKSFSPITKDSDNVKEIEKISEEIITQAYIEICIMKEPHLATHANIVRLCGVRTSGWGNSALRISLITEYADLGSLDSYISLHHKELEWNLKIQILSDVVSGLTALHDCDIVHNDVKCANILLFVNSANNRITEGRSGRSSRS